MFRVGPPTPVLSWENVSKAAASERLGLRTTTTIATRLSRRAPAATKIAIVTRPERLNSAAVDSYPAGPLGLRS
jgi:hypothetical protein